MPTFKMKNPPRKPKREMRYITLELDQYGITYTLAEIEAYFLSEGVDPSEVFFSCEEDYEAGFYCRFSVKREETDEELAQRVVTYNKQLATYKQWEEENKEQIEEYKRKKEKERQEKLDTEYKQLQAQYQKQLKKLEDLKCKVSSHTLKAS